MKLRKFKMKKNIKKNLNLLKKGLISKKKTVKNAKNLMIKGISFTSSLTSKSIESVSTKIRNWRINRLKKKIQSLKDEIKYREQYEKKLIENRLKELDEEKDDELGNIIKEFDEEKENTESYYDRLQNNKKYEFDSTSRNYDQQINSLQNEVESLTNDLSNLEIDKRCESYPEFKRLQEEKRDKMETISSKNEEISNLLLEKAESMSRQADELKDYISDMNHKMMEKIKELQVEKQKRFSDLDKKFEKLKKETPSYVRNITKNKKIELDSLGKKIKK